MLTGLYIECVQKGPKRHTQKTKAGREARSDMVNCHRGGHGGGTGPPEDGSISSSGKTQLKKFVILSESCS